jgi:hypothetical protein
MNHSSYQFPRPVSIAETGMQQNLYAFAHADKLSIEFIASSGQAAQIKIHDILGRPLQAYSLPGIGGKRQYIIDISGLISGVYMVQIDCAGQHFSESFTIAH